MARRGRNRSRLLVPDARVGMERLRADALRREGYRVDPERPETAKYEVAQAIGVTLAPGYNGHLSTESAGKVGGVMGGLMVKELVKLAREQLAKR